MDEVLARADALADAIRESERFKAMRQIEAEVTADEETRRLASELQATTALIQKKEAEQTPIEPEEKHRLAKLQERWGASEAVARLTEAQNAFLAMMEQVNRKIHGALHDAEETPEDSAD